MSVLAARLVLLVAGPTSAVRRAAPLRAAVACNAAQCGDRPPQSLPTFLMPYHEQSLSLTEAAFNNCTVRCSRGLSYGSELHQTLDVWAPATGGSGLPIVVSIHGGGWEFGFPEWAGFPAQHVCTTPALLVAPAYALGEGRRQAWPASRDDLLQALRWVGEHGAAYGGDPSRIVLTGHSAGGHLASCLGLNPPLLRDAGIDPAAIRALFLVSCPVGIRAEDFAPRHWLWTLWIGRPFIRALYSKVAPNLRAVIGAPPNEATATEASALASVLTADPATLPPVVHITYGVQGDFPFCKPQARRLQRILQQLPGGPRVDILEVAGAGHFDTHYELADGSSAWYSALREVLEQGVGD